MLSALSNNKHGCKCAREKCEEDLGIPWPKYRVIERKEKGPGRLQGMSKIHYSKYSQWYWPAVSLLHPTPTLNTPHNNLLHAHGNFSQYTVGHLCYVVFVPTPNAGCAPSLHPPEQRTGLWVTTAQASLCPGSKLWLELVSPVPVLPYLRRFERQDFFLRSKYWYLYLEYCLACVKGSVNNILSRCKN